ncbi:MAG TPA: Ig-like domain-containing protein [Pyrinomonadaceae bacterium]|nr:Ig-like domain-containing protein [Pyrinomonadaceae bacterium]
MRLIVIGVFFILLPQAAQAAGTLIPAPARVDMVYDSSRDVVYITSGSSVLRYQIGTNSFLSPFELGGTLSGIDLSPDGNTLVVADRTRSATEVWIHLVDLQTGQSRKATFPRGFGEGGTFTVAFGNDGAVLVSSTYEGSGWVPLRRYDPATGASSQVASSITQNTMLTASADGSVIGFAESNISDGRFGRYRVADGNLLRKSGYTDGTSWYNYEMGVNRNGTQYAIPTYGGTYIYDGNLSRITILGQYAGPQPIGVAYHPAENIVYFAWTGSTEVRAFDTASFAQVAAYDFEHSFTNTGNFAFQQGRLKISRDGSLLFATVNGGVRYLRLYAPLVADGQSVVTDEDNSASITLTGSVGNGGALTYSVASNPSHGTLSGAAPYLVYTPNADYHGDDSFTFKTTYGAASATATVSLTVNPVNDRPVADNQNVTTSEDMGKMIIPSGSDVDGDHLNYVIVSGPSHGTVGGVGPYPVYTPDANYNGSDSFTFKANDGTADSELATVTITVLPVNDAPSANSQSVTTSEDTGKAVTLSGSDIENDALSYVIVSGPSRGSLSGTGANRVYTPGPNYNGTDSFTFKVNDGLDDSGVATVMITITPVNDAPTAAADSAVTIKNTSVSIAVLANDHDVDGDSMTVTGVTQGTQGGTVLINGGAAGVTYKPRLNFTGVESFTYTVSDGKGGTATATVFVTVNKK